MLVLRCYHFLLTLGLVVVSFSMLPWRGNQLWRGVLQMRVLPIGRPEGAYVIGALSSCRCVRWRRCDNEMRSVTDAGLSGNL